MAAMRGQGRVQGAGQTELQHGPGGDGEERGGGPYGGGGGEMRGRSKGESEEQIEEEDTRYIFFFLGGGGRERISHLSHPHRSPFIPHLSLYCPCCAARYALWMSSVDSQLRWMVHWWWGEGEPPGELGRWAEKLGRPLRATGEMRRRGRGTERRKKGVLGALSFSLPASLTVDLGDW